MAGDRLLVAPQEFKGSLSPRQAADAISAGAARVWPIASIDQIPLSDGGPGLVDALVAADQGELRPAEVTDPLGRPITASYGLLHARRTAVVEMAAASGLSLLRTPELDPLNATTFGTGQLIRAALDDGVDEIIIGIGGSATNDGGAGMMLALGARLLDEDGRMLKHGGAALSGLAKIDVSGLDTRLKSTRVVAASDVLNPLCGPNGASAVYGPQKGADAQAIAVLDHALARYAEILKHDLGVDVAGIPGAGAAGENRGWAARVPRRRSDPRL